MSTVPVLPPKEDVAKEIGRIASTLTNDMQNAALRKARELGFDLSRGRLSLDETLINLSWVRDVLLDASNKGKLAHLPLKLQYILHSQSQKVAETLATLVNGVDSVQVLEDVVDDLTSSAWQYNLHNLSDEVLGFQQKMNQLKAQETLIREAFQQGQELQAVSVHARSALQDIETMLSTAKESGGGINTTLEKVAEVLTKVIETEQKILGIAVQAEQTDAAATRHESNAKASAATAQTIADKLPELQSEIQKDHEALVVLHDQTRVLISNVEQSSDTTLSDLRSQYEQVKAATESETGTLRDAIEKKSEELQTTVTTLVTGAAEELRKLQSDHDTKLNETRRSLNEEASNTITTLDKEFRAALLAQGTEFNEQHSTNQKEYTRLVATLDTLEGQIKESIRRATGFSLFHSFQKRQEDLVKSKNVWAKALAGVVLTSVCLSVAFIIYVNFVSSFGPGFYLKLSISLPLIYAIWFCSIQYARERRLEEEYAFKASISISLDPYRELVEKLVVKDKPEELAKYTAFIIDSVGKVFTSPTETAFDHAKDASPAEGIVKAAGGMVTDILKVVKKM